MEKISELNLVPALQQLFDILPIEIAGFHSDNGSEYVKYLVTELLEKLRIEFTKPQTKLLNRGSVNMSFPRVLDDLIASAGEPFRNTGVSELWMTCEFRSISLNSQLSLETHSKNSFTECNN